MQSAPDPRPAGKRASGREGRAGRSGRRPSRPSRRGAESPAQVGMAHRAAARPFRENGTTRKPQERPPPGTFPRPRRRRTDGAGGGDAAASDRTNERRTPGPPRTWVPQNRRGGSARLARASGAPREAGGSRPKDAFAPPSSGRRPRRPSRPSPGDDGRRGRTRERETRSECRREDGLHRPVLKHGPRSLTYVRVPTARKTAASGRARPKDARARRKARHERSRRRPEKKDPRSP